MKRRHFGLSSTKNKNKISENLKKTREMEAAWRSKQNNNMFYIINNLHDQNTYN